MVPSRTLPNPFTPDKAASAPDEFFGREEQVRNAMQVIADGDVGIYGPIGIGKTSFLQHILLKLEQQRKLWSSHMAVATKGVSSLDDAAHLLLKRVVHVDSEETARQHGINKILSFGRTRKETKRPFAEGRRLDHLEDYLYEQTIDPERVVLLAFDDADKCPGPLAQLYRSLRTWCSHQHIRNVRFIFCGVSPYLGLMAKEDQGVVRFLLDKVEITLFTRPESEQLVTEKLDRVEAFARDKKIPFAYEEDMIRRMVQLAGDHPHILQLLGHHLIRNENAEPDGVLNIRDLCDALTNICYQQRGWIYVNTLHELELQGSKDKLLGTLFGEAISYCPTQIRRDVAIKIAGADAMRWFVTNNVFRLEGSSYRLIDELLRIRMIMDRLSTDEERLGVERQLLVSDDYEEERGYYVVSELEEPLGEGDVGVDSIRDYENLPHLQLRVRDNPGVPLEPILFEVYAKARLEETADIDPEWDEVTVSVFSDDDSLVGRRPVEMHDRVVVNCEEWALVGKAALPTPTPGNYWAHASLKIRDAGPPDIAVESQRVRVLINERRRG